MSERERGGKRGREREIHRERQRENTSTFFLDPVSNGVDINLMETVN